MGKNWQDRPWRHVELALAVIIWLCLSWHSGSVRAAVSLAGVSSIDSGGSGAASIDVPVPAGLVAGDVLLAQVAVRGGLSITPGAGWTLVASQGLSGGNLRQAVYWRVASGSEPASYSFKFGGSDRAAAAILAYRGVDNAVPIDQASTPGVASGSTVTAAGFTTGYSATQLVAFYSVAHAASFTPPGALGERYDVSTTAGPNGVAIAAADAGQAASAGVSNQNASASSSAANIGQLVALKPAAVLRADYRFDECAYAGTAGEVADSTGSHPASARNGLTTAAPGVLGRYGNFDDYSRWAQTSLGLAGDYSLSVWFKMPFSSPGSTSQYHVLASVAGGGDLFFVDRNSSGGAYRWGVYNGSIVNGSYRFSTLADGWHHLAVVARGNNTDIYVDGVLRDTLAARSAGTLSYLGTSYDSVNGSGAQGFRAPLDEFMIWDYALNASQIASIRSNQLAGLNYDGSTRSASCGALASFGLNTGTGNASTCSPRTITITARDGNGATLTAYTGTIALTTSSSLGDWAKVSANGSLSNGTANDGAASYTFTAADNGVAALSLLHGHAADVQLSVVDQSQPSSASTAAAIAFRDNAIVVASDESAAFNAANPAASVVARRPHKMKFELWTKDSGGLCALLPYTKTGVAAQFWLTPDANHPAAATAPSVSAAANCSAALGPLGSSKAAAGSLTLNFTAGSASFYLCSSEVGKFVLNAGISAPAQVGAAVIIDGSSSTLTVRPLALAVSQIRAGATDNPNGAAASEAVFAAAGAAFAMNVAAYGFSSAADADSDGQLDAGASLAQLSAPGVLPAFAASASFGATLNTPAGGVAGTLKTGTASVTLTAGSGSASDLYYTEVGSFHLTGAAGSGAALANYLGSAGVNVMPAVFNAAGARNDVIGRFIPAELRLGAITRTHRSDIAPADLASCGGSTFSYLGENFAVQFTLSAHAASPGSPITANYAGSFARLGLDAGGLAFDVVSGSTSLAGKLAVSCAGSCGTWSAGSAAVSATLSVARAVSAACTAAEKPEGPYDAAVLGMSPRDADGVMLQTPFDFDRLADGSADGRQLASAALRFGRLHLSSAIGSETLNLVVPLSAQYWNGVGFITNTADHCTKLTAANVKLSGYNPASYASAVPQANVQLASGFTLGGVANLRIAKPLTAAKGTFALCIDLDSGAAGDSTCQASAPAAKTFLQEYASCGSYGKDPATRLGFGLYKPPGNFIHFRENF